MVSIGPKLGSIDRASSIGDALFSKTRRGILALLFGHAGKAFYRNEIARLAANGAIGQVQRELDRMTSSGLIVREMVGNQAHYRANPDSAVFHELVRLVTKTFGIADVVRNILKPLTGRIEVAFIYGSVARGEQHATSDVDLFVLGDVLLSELDPALTTLEASLGRSVSPTVLDVRTYRKRVASDDHFIKSVLAGPKIFVVSDAVKLKSLSEGRAR